MKVWWWCCFSRALSDYIVVDDALKQISITTHLELPHKVGGDHLAWQDDYNSRSQSTIKESSMGAMSTETQSPPLHPSDGEIAWSLACLSYLPLTFYRNPSQSNTSKTVNVKSLLFPSSASVRECLSLNSESLTRYLQRAKFCIGTFSLDPLSFIGELSPLRVGISVGLCIPDHCTSQSFTRLFGLLCSIPECSSLRESKLIEVCSYLQPLLCGPLDRFTFEHQFRLTCLEQQDLEIKDDKWNEEVEHFKEDFEAVQHIIDDLTDPKDLLALLRALLPAQALRNAATQQMPPSGDSPVHIPRSLTAANARRFREDDDEAGEVYVNPDFTPGTQSEPRALFTNAGDAQIDADYLNVLLDCGVSTLAQAPSLYLKTGGFQNLGAWDQCPSDSRRAPSNTTTISEQGGRYCFMRYLSLLGSGHCVSAKCDGKKMALLARMLCDMSSGGLGVWQTCLDLVNIVPIDLCVLIQLFGCNDYTKLNAVLDRNVDLWTIISSSLGRSDMSYLPEDAPKRFLAATNTLWDQFPIPVASLLDLHQLDRLSLPLRRLSTNRQHLQLRPVIDVRPPGELSCEVFCDYSSLPRKSVTFVICIILLGTYFVLLPLAAYITKAFSEAPSESINELAPRSTAQKLLLYQYPRSPKPSSARSTRRDRTSPPLGPSLNSSSISSPARDLKTIEPPRSNLEALLLCFHPGDNWSAYEATIKNVKNGEFPHLCGLRVISMIWIVITHTFSLMATTGLVSNVKTGLQLIQRFDFQLIIGGMYAVDSFFFFTGFLVAVYGGPSLQIVMQSASRGAAVRNQASKLLLNLKILFFSILHRYLRLGGVYFFLLMLWTWGVPHLSSGPMWPALTNWIRHGYLGGCEKYWWTNVLFINNIIPHFGGGDCMGWTWYLANDFQFFIISTSLLLIRRASVKSFVFLCVVLLFGSWAIALVTVVQNQLTTALMGACLDNGMQALLFETVRANEMFYSKPWCRFPPHLIGVIWGVLYRTGSFESWLIGGVRPIDRSTPSELSVSEKLGETPRPESAASSPPLVKIPLPRMFRRDPPASREAAASPAVQSLSNGREEDVVARRALMPWIHVLAALTMAATVFVQYGPNNSPFLFWPRWIDVAYQVFSRSIWALCLGWFCVSLTYAISEHRNRPRLLDYKLSSSGVPPFLSIPSPVADDWLSRTLLRLWGAPVFIALASFCYCVYLLHPMLQSVYFGSSLTSFYESQGVGYFDGVGFCILSFLIAIPFTICIEISLSKCARLIGV